MKGVRKIARKENLIKITTKRLRDNNDSHHQIIMGTYKNRNVSVGLTTKQKKGKNSNSTNYKLERSPFEDNELSYMRRQGQVRLKRDYFDTKYGVMTQKDYKVAQVYANRAKEKYIKKEQRNAKRSK